VSIKTCDSVRSVSNIVIVDEERCKACELCVQICPRKVLTMGTTLNARGYHYVLVTAPEKCTGCALCALMCPDAALEVAREDAL
jgi:2-oxoglutarate ferredoxin oxidoreductase subunit delta